MVTTRRAAIGGAGALLLAGLGWRAWDRGVFAAGEGAAFDPWNDWRGHAGEGPRQTLRAAILAANPHDTQPWLFHVRNDAIEIYADLSRNLGAMDAFVREMHLGIGCAIQNALLAAPSNVRTDAAQAGNRSTRTRRASGSSATVGI